MVMSKKRAKELMNIAFTHWDGNKKVHDIARKYAVDRLTKEMLPFDSDVTAELIKELYPTSPVIVDKLVEYKGMSLLKSYIEAIEAGEIKLSDYDHSDI
jgi:hypothetical protein